jgi:hypothetical protein
MMVCRGRPENQGFWVMGSVSGICARRSPGVLVFLGIALVFRFSQWRGRSERLASVHAGPRWLADTSGSLVRVVAWTRAGCIARVRSLFHLFYHGGRMRATEGHGASPCRCRHTICRCGQISWYVAFWPARCLTSTRYVSRRVRDASPDVATIFFVAHRGPPASFVLRNPWPDTLSGGEWRDTRSSNNGHVQHSFHGDEGRAGDWHGNQPTRHFQRHGSLG